MLKPYDLLENVLIAVEKSIREDINPDVLAETFSISEGHLRRLFKFAFRQTLSSYIRSRKLAESVDDLLNTNAKILSIALDYGFEYEQSYNRTFKREFGVTPGELRKSGKIVKVTPPLHLFDSNRFRDGLIFGPDIVMVPQFHVIGKKHKIPTGNPSYPPTLSKHFLLNEKQKIKNAVNPGEIIDICSYSSDPGFWNFMPALQVKKNNNIPEGFETYTFPTSLCARFHFIYSGFDLKNYKTDDIIHNIDKIITYPDDMFKAVDEFMGSKEHNYFLDRKVNINKFYLPNKKENYIQFEWLAPVVKKSS